MRRSRRNIAINRQKIYQKCKRWKELMEGSRAYRSGLTENPYDRGSVKYKAWKQGWDFAQEIITE